jgi:RimJ/RimL family protein N-acetyltransferase
MLKGDRVNLRTVREKDLEQFIELASDIGSRGDHYPQNMLTETSMRARYAKDGFWGEDYGFLLIVDKETDRILGQVVQFKPVHYYDALEIGYIIFNPGDRGKGHLTEALKLFCKYLFKSKPIHRLQVQTEPGNLASRRAAEKAGFKFEGTARSAIIKDGQPADINMFSLLRKELE